jgi:hypothetical protein
MTGRWSSWARIAGFVLATGSALLLQPCAANAANSADPVAIDQCRIIANRAYVSAYKPILLSFTNQRIAPANEVRFTIRYAGRTEQIDDKGSFLENVRIDHAFNGFYNLRYRGPSPSVCRVDYVGFSDGTAWPAPSAAPAPS